jgi:hypothetical protein
MERERAVANLYLAISCLTERVFIVCDFKICCVVKVRALTGLRITAVISM